MEWRERCLRLASMPLMAASDTVRSTALSPSLTDSVADFWVRTEVEKRATGAMRTARKALVDVRVRKDIVKEEIPVFEFGFWKLLRVV